MATLQNVRIRLTLSPLHTTYITQQMDAWIQAFNQSSLFPDITAHLISSSLDLIQVNIDHTSTIPFYDNYNCLVSIIQHSSPHRLILTISLPLSSIIDPHYQIISHATQPTTISDSIRPFRTTDGTPATSTPDPIIRTTFSLPINAEELSWSAPPYNLYKPFRSKNGYISTLPQDPQVHAIPPTHLSLLTP